MTEISASVIDLVALLMSRGMSPETSLETAREIDSMFGLSTARGRGSDAATREKWRLKARRRRARIAGKFANVPGDVSRGQSQTLLIEDNNSLKLVKKVSKSETMSPGDVSGDKPKRSKGDVLPAEWAPTESHYAKGVELGMSRSVVDGYAARMRNWADANAHRQVARKAGVRGWNAAFMNWLSSAHERNGGSHAANRNGSEKLGFAALAARIGGGAFPEVERSPSAHQQPHHRR